MKKLILASALALTSSLSFAAATAITATTAGASAALTQTQCGVVGAGETATIRFSAGVAGAYECSATVAVVGTYHSQGRGRTYVASSVGGAIAENTSTNVAADVGTAFTAAGSGSGSGG